MSVVLLVIIGAAAGFLATRLMDVQTSVPVTVAIGVLGALVGSLLLRLVLAMTGMAFGFLGAVLGAIALIWLWQRFFHN
ncbi:GlsB/YeaQ/YmgE family stress response membrane protein [Aliiroseovarius sp.]|uniref:GlsB/YeaQ/YmgE family stress response membrane protein n=1 Tax=Aliiroseovarius sp. TaxID=1872442 RepID=UPI002624849D|nr:GlsB/YeaQ/YmgE family stress response membrane protein [Aliiroseovarius sp.]